MSGKPVVHDASSCPSFNGLVQIFGEEKYVPVVEEYHSILQTDPDYMSYHHTSTALRLQFQLKLEDFPDLCIGSCINESTGECCVVTALREVIRQRHPYPARHEGNDVRESAATK